MLENSSINAVKRGFTMLKVPEGAVNQTSINNLGLVLSSLLDGEPVRS